MRVLFITSSYPAHAGDPRGTFVHELARALVAEGVEITVLAPGAPGAPAREVRDGVRVHRARYWPDRWQGLASGLSGIVPNLRHRPWLVFQVPPLVLALTWHAMRLGREADVIHAHWVYPSGIAGLAAARRNRKPLVVTSHGGDLNLAAKVPPLRALAAFIAKRADACLGVSQAMVERFVRLGVPPGRVRHIPLGVSALAPRSANEDSIPADAKAFAAYPGLKVVYAGSLVSNKSVDTLLEAHRLTSEGGADVTCLIVGTGPTEPQLRRMVSQSCADRVVFVGEKPPDRVASYVRLADVLVLPSRAEGLGLVLVQAMMMGVAVIASDISGPRELIEDGVTGILFPPGDSEQLAGKLAWLATSPEAARDLGARGRLAMEAQRRTPESSAATHHSIYARLADVGGRRGAA